MPDLMLGAVIIFVGVLAVGLGALMAFFWYAKRSDGDDT